jgi:hypothetical protein
MDETMRKEPKRISAAELLCSADPLSDDACVSLVNYREEDDLVDFKEAFDWNHDKSWIDLAVDCAAFANTKGGYLVLGVRDKSWQQIGVDDSTCSVLGDVKRVLEKINRGLSPPLTRTRTRVIELAGLRFVVVYVPCIGDQTHVFESNLDLKVAGGAARTIVRQGAIYVRRSGSNAIMTAADLEELVTRRIDRFKSRILEGLARVVTAGPNEDVITVAKQVDDASAVRYRVVNAPPDGSIEGATLAIAGNTLKDRVALFMALSSGENRYEVDDSLLYEAYASRDAEQWTESQRDWLCMQSLRAGLPSFYWLRARSVAESRGLISSAFDNATFINRLHLLSAAGFYGEGFHERMLSRLGPIGRERGARPFRDLQSLFGTVASKSPEHDSKRATELATSLSKKAMRAAQDRYDLQRLDCALYAPF